MKNKLILSIALILGVLLIDQWVKYYVKTHFFLGEEINIMGNWFKIHFTENYGMAFGMEFGGKSGKLLLTLFRVIAIGFIGWYIVSLTKKKSHIGYLLSWTFIMAGAIGNLIDSVFYGVWFGYDTWLHGRVVDMFYFPIIHTTIPDSFPIWAGEEFEFFRPVFNVADASISIGFIAILLFQRTFMKAENNAAEESNSINENPA